MAEPVSPVIPGVDLKETVYGGKGYENLPAVRNADGDVVSRWHFSEEERQKFLETGDIYVMLKTFNHPLQPIWLGVEPPLMPEQKSPALADSVLDADEVG